MAEHWPHSLLATATHDTKRGEDARARIDAISEYPAEWTAGVQRWSTLNRDKKAIVDGQPAPDANDEYFFYQTLIGAWLSEAKPISPSEMHPLRQRLTAYILKAVKESKHHTSWINPDAAYESAIENFVAATLGDSNFLKDFLKLQQAISWVGYLNSLSQVLLKMTCPGVPDFYQGSELWDFNLVDPDNRRPVDFESRRRMLAEVDKKVREAGKRQVVQGLLEQLGTGEIKLFLISQTLRSRAAHRELFQRGEYIPLPSSGNRREHICAFARQFRGEQIIVIAPRLYAPLVTEPHQFPLGQTVWEDTTVALPETIPDGCYRNLFTDEQVATTGEGPHSFLKVAEVLTVCPFCLLFNGADSSHSRRGNEAELGLSQNPRRYLGGYD